jgi:hypothetical protein
MLSDLSKFVPFSVSLLGWLFLFAAHAQDPPIFYYLIVISTMYVHFGSFIEAPITSSVFYSMKPFPLMLRKNNLGEAHASLLATRFALSMGMKPLILEEDYAVIIMAVNNPKVIADWQI